MRDGSGTMATRWSRSGWLALGALAAAAVAAACASSLESIGEFPCADNGGCPDGWVCVDSSWTCRSTTNPGGSDAGGTGERLCEDHTDCNGGTGQGCVAIVGGGSACWYTCTGFQSGCGASGDCKLVASGVKYDNGLVPVCATYGTTSEGSLCSSVNECAKGLTCTHNSGVDEYLCTQMCNPFVDTCDNGAKSCSYSVNGSPAGWGFCF